MMDKYKEPPQAPPVFTGTKESIVKDAQAMCDKTKKLLDDLVAKIPADDSSQTTFENVILPQIEDENQSSLTGRILGFYQYVSSDKELREASNEAEKIMDECSIELGMREDVFQIVDAVFQKKDTLNLDPESLRLLEKERKSYIRNGLSLPAGPKRERFMAIKKRLSEIQIQFNKALNEEDGSLWLTPKELDGVPADLVEGLPKGSDENDGKVKLSFKYPDLFPTLKFAKNAETRKTLFIANENKVSWCPRMLLWLSCLPGCSAIKMRLSSKRPSFSVTRQHVFWDTPTTLRSRLRRRC